jgi:competence protein ComEA
MNIFARLQETFGFTRNELKVILFLAGALLIGAGLRWALSSSRPAPASGFDYAAADRDFAERSRPPTSGTPARPTPSTPSRTPAVNVNTAGREELMRLPGIGGVYADRILRYRREHGPFATVDDLDAVKGIGKKTLERLRPYVRVR